jgi:hypothetical protein
VEEGIVIESADQPRAGWGDAARVLRERGEDGILDEVVATDFDNTEWVWD